MLLLIKYNPHLATKLKLSKIKLAKLFSSPYKEML